MWRENTWWIILRDKLVSSHAGSFQGFTARQLNIFYNWQMVRTCSPSEDSMREGREIQNNWIPKSVFRHSLLAFWVWLKSVGQSGRRWFSPAEVHYHSRPLLFRCNFLFLEGSWLGWRTRLSCANWNPFSTNIWNNNSTASCHTGWGSGPGAETAAFGPQQVDLQLWQVAPL